MVSAGRRYYCLPTITIIGAFLRIGGPPIESPYSLTGPEKMSCRNTKKLTKAKWLLGKECAENVGVEWKGRVSRMSWIMNDKIKQWGITWRDSTLTNTSVSLGINGDLGSALMMSHDMTLLALREVHDEFFPFALAPSLRCTRFRPEMERTTMSLSCLTPHCATWRCASMHRREASSS